MFGDYPDPRDSDDRHLQFIPMEDPMGRWGPQMRNGRAPTPNRQTDRKIPNCGLLPDRLDIEQTGQLHACVPFVAHFPTLFYCFPSPPRTSRTFLNLEWRLGRRTLMPRKMGGLGLLPRQQLSQARETSQTDRPIP